MQSNVNIVCRTLKPSYIGLLNPVMGGYGDKGGGGGQLFDMSSQYSFTHNRMVLKSAHCAEYNKSH